MPHRRPRGNGAVVWAASRFTPAVPLTRNFPGHAPDRVVMPPNGACYPAVLQAVMNHAQRLRGFLEERERKARPYDHGAPWLIGRAGELQCVVALVALDWYQERLSTQEAALRLSRYVREIHDGLAMHLDVGMPPCCHLPLARAGSRPSETKRPARVQPALLKRLASRT